MSGEAGRVLRDVKIEHCYVIRPDGSSGGTAVVKTSTFVDGSQTVKVRGGTAGAGDQLVSMPLDERGAPVDESRGYISARWTGSGWTEGASEAEIATWNAVKRPKLEEAVRAERDRLLSRSDWTQLPDTTVTSPEAWREYRQKLRDIPAQEGFPLRVRWPYPPTEKEAESND